MIFTKRLELVPATEPLVRAALDSSAALQATLGADVPPSWPPEYLDPPSLEFTLARLDEGPEQAGWWLHFVVLRGGAANHTLIGSAGFCGPPASEGTIEIGYGIVADRRRQGYATETVRGLLDRAFHLPATRRVIAHTLPSLIPSIGVLHKCGFHLLGDGPEPGTIRFEISRGSYELGPSAV